MKDSTADVMNDALDFLNGSMEVIHEADRMTHAQRLDSLFCGEIEPEVAEIVDTIWVYGVDTEAPNGRQYNTAGKVGHLDRALRDAGYETCARSTAYHNDELAELHEQYDRDQPINPFTPSAGDALYDPDETGSRERTLETLAWHYVVYGEDAVVEWNGYCAKDLVVDVVDSEGNGNVEWLGFIEKVRDDLEL